MKNKIKLNLMFSLLDHSISKTVMVKQSLDALYPQIFINTRLIKIILQCRLYQVIRSTSANNYCRI